MAKQITDREFEVIIYENQPLILKICSLYTSTESDKEDLFQEIVINLWKGIHGFKGNSQLSTWIYKVGLNTAISRSRKQKKNKLFYTAAVPDIAGPQSDPYNDQIRALYQAIDKLKPAEKAIVLLYLEDKSYEEISEIVGISKSNVSVKLVRLKRKLEKLIKPKQVKN
ncbi:RNA polymerase sigma factor [Roseivirga sp.]|uniref:RNA polymerase sigma factor n=1 Tax=Roseivirga sp. TaxID=1964215 RepID=UPI003B52C150